MARFIIDLWLDGYDNEEKMISACIEYLNDSLTMTASSYKLIKIIKDDEDVFNDNSTKLS